MHWKEFPDSEAQWEPAENLENASGKIREFWAFKGQPCFHSL
jgi:hypothetical protein